MSLTRKMLKGMGLTDEQADTIIEAHTETVDGLKNQVSTYKEDADKLPGVQKELDDLKAAGDGGYKQKYEKEHSDFEAFKADISSKQTKAAKEKAVRAYFESKGIKDANLTLAMRGCGEEMAALELDGEKIKDTKALDDLISSTYASLVSTSTEKGAPPPEKPPKTGGGAMSREEIMKIKDTGERQKAIAENHELFGF